MSQKTPPPIRKIAFQIPLKARPSERVPNKNFRDFGGGIRLWDRALAALFSVKEDDWDIYLDTEDPSAVEEILEKYPDALVHQRDPWLVSNQANGNHIFTSFGYRHPNYELFGQVLVTAPFLTGQTIKQCVNHVGQFTYDSSFPVTEETGFYWKQEPLTPLNYDPFTPNGAPRTQDNKMYKETNGVYIITKEALFKYNTRIGRNPFPVIVKGREALDIDTWEDIELMKEHLKNDV